MEFFSSLGLTLSFLSKKVKIKNKPFRKKVIAMIDDSISLTGSSDLKHDKSLGAL
jgi:hypothetical protein